MWNKLINPFKYLPLRQAWCWGIGGHKNAAGGKSFVSMEETIAHYIASVKEFVEEGGLSKKD